ncbi:MAG: hypothetical protein ACW9W4_10515 [Candidatus Nitrosopumilus sp. bin_7KS]
MPVSLTPFQLWSLFLMFKNPDGEFTQNQLLLQCCDSAMATLDEDQIDSELQSFESSGYIKNVSHSEPRYQISGGGIIFVRKNMAKIQTACDNVQIHSDIINKQDVSLKTAIRNRENLTPMIMECALKNIKPILDLINSLT